MRWKRWVGGGVVVVGGMLAVPVLAIGSAFIGNAPLVDGQVLGPLTTIVDGYVAAYVGDAADGSVYLIDAGSDPSGAAIDAALAKRGKTPADVRTLLITHGHADHIAACARFPNAEVLALDLEVPMLQGEVAAKGPIPRWFTNDDTCKVTRAVHDGEILDIGGTPIAVYGIPGHTAGSAVYVVGGVAVFGDAVSGESDGHVKGPPWIFNDDTAEADASIVALAKRLPPEVEWLAFAHTGPIAGLGPLKAFEPR